MTEVVSILERDTVKNKGRIVSICGPMFSKKTTTLITTANMYVRSNSARIVIFAPTMSRRSESQIKGIRSHDEVQPLCETKYIDQTALLQQCKKYVEQALFDLDHDDLKVRKNIVVCIDEAQFFTNLIEACCWMRSKNVSVLVSGLSLTSDRKPFGEMHRLLDFSDEIIFKKTICGICFDYNGTLTFRTVDSTEEVLIGGGDSYIPVCQTCYCQVKLC